MTTTFVPRHEAKRSPVRGRNQNSARFVDSRRFREDWHLCEDRIAFYTFLTGLEVPRRTEVASVPLDRTLAAIAASPIRSKSSGTLISPLRIPRRLGASLASRAEAPRVDGWSPDAAIRSAGRGDQFGFRRGLQC
jgi:hypothetical protein